MLDLSFDTFLELYLPASFFKIFFKKSFRSGMHKMFCFSIWHPFFVFSNYRQGQPARNSPRNIFASFVAFYTPFWGEDSVRNDVTMYSCGSFPLNYEHFTLRATQIHFKLNSFWQFSVIFCSVAWIAAVIEAILRP